MSLKRRLLTSHLLTSLVPLVVVGVSSYLVVVDGLRDRSVASLAAVADGQQARVESVVEQNAERLALVTSRTQLRISLRRHLAGGDEAERRRMERILGDALDSIDDFHRIRVVDVQGRVVAAVERPGASSRAVTLPAEDLVRALEVPVLDGLRQLDDGSWSWQLAGPLALDGETLGAIVVDSSLSKIESAGAGVASLGSTARMHVLAGRAHAAVVTGGPLAGHIDELLSVAASVTELRAQGVPPTLAVQRSVKPAGLHLVISIDRAEVFEGMRMLSVVLAVAFVVVVVVILLFAVRLASSIAAPLTRLARAASRLGTLDFKARADVEVDDEIRALTDAFNEMAVRVATMNEDLEAQVRERTEQVGHANDRLAQVVALQTAILTSADAAIITTDAAGVVTLFNPAAERLLGFGAEEVVGKLPITAFHDVKELAIAGASQVRRSISGGTTSGGTTSGGTTSGGATSGGAGDGEQSGSVHALFRAAEASVEDPTAPRRRGWTYVRKDGSRVRVLVALARLGGGDVESSNGSGGHLAIVTVAE